MENRLFTAGNSMSAPYGEVGGGRAVWAYALTHENLLPGGCSITMTAIPDGSLLQAGTPIKVSSFDHLAVPSLTFSVYETAALGATSLKVNKLMNNSVAKVGMFIMAEPATFATSGTGIQVTAVDTSNALYDVFTVAELAAQVTAGAVYVECDKAGAGAVYKNIPTHLLAYDVPKYADATTYSCSAAFGGAIYERRIPPIPAALKTVLPKVTFLKSK